MIVNLQTNIGLTVKSRQDYERGHVSQYTMLAVETVHDLPFTPPSEAIATLPSSYDLAQQERFIEQWNSLSGGPPLDAVIHNSRNGSIFSVGNWLDCIFGNSPYLSKLALSYPDILGRVVDGGLDENWTNLLERVACSPIDDRQSLMVNLRTFKGQASLLIALGEISGIWSLSDTMAKWSDFADQCVSKTLSSILHSELLAGNLSKHGDDALFARSGIFVLALGKLGARELNFSSDLDLMILFDPEALPYSGSKSHHEFAVKVAKAIVAILDQRTADGYVFRIDLRLRPDPSSTAIAVSTAAAEQYYESWGQNWERSALIKSRVIAGDERCGTEFLQRLEPFIWRKSLDFYAIQDIHSIKRQIYASKGGREVDVVGHDIKTGRGGIREIEFFAQIQQLIWGGRIPELREPTTLGALTALADNNLVEGSVVSDLTNCYIFLRHLEHRIQMINDEQTQRIPAKHEDAMLVSNFFGYSEFDGFAKDVTRYLTTVETHYAELFEDAPTLTVEGNLVFTGAEHDPETIQNLERLGFENAETVSRLVREWHYGKYRATKSTKSRQILTEIMPNIISAFSKTVQPDRAFIKFDQFLQSLPAGVQIFSIFQRHSELLELVADVMGNAPRMADYLTGSPQRLDYVLEPEFFSPLPDRSNLALELQQTLAREDGFESELDASRRWTNDMRFRVGIQAMRGDTSLEYAADALTAIAETTINALTRSVGNEFASKFGVIEEGEFAIFANGKLAARELTPSSDLDLVFIYDAPSDAQSTGGERSLPASAYFLRFAQRVISALTVMTAEGRLYDVDLRLRPAGEQGPVASSLNAFDKYHQEDAWLWERLALIRGRVIYAEKQLGQKVERIRRKILGKSVPETQLAETVSEMRSRIHANAPSTDGWDIKRSAGGLMDTEFLLHFHILRIVGKLPDAVGTSTSELIALLREYEGLEEQDIDTIQHAHKLWSTISWLLRLALTDTAVELNKLPLGLERRLLAHTGMESVGELEEKISDYRVRICDLIERDILCKCSGDNQLNRR